MLLEVRNLFDFNESLLWLYRSIADALLMRIKRVSSETWEKTGRPKKNTKKINKRRAGRLNRQWENRSSPGSAARAIARMNFVPRDIHSNWYELFDICPDDCVTRVSGKYRRFNFFEYMSFFCVLGIQWDQSGSNITNPFSSIIKFICYAPARRENNFFFCNIPTFENFLT